MSAVHALRRDAVLALIGFGFGTIAVMLLS